MKTCRDCGQEKSYLEFRGDTDLCRKCSTKSAVVARLAKRDDLRPPTAYLCGKCSELHNQLLGVNADSETAEDTIEQARRLAG